MNERGFTAAICTYNGADRIPAVLDRLRGQVGVDDVPFEVVVADNNSSDETEAVVRAYQAEWPSASSLRYVFEPRQGKVFAMRSAVEQARGSLIGFLDDDNLPAEDWVSEAVRFARTHPQAGAFGGRIYPRYQEEPPEDMEEIEGIFAVVREEEPFRYPPGGSLGRMFAPGAGLVVRREAWSGSLPEELRLNFTGSRLDTFEDMEIQWHIYRHGWQVWHNPRMELEHDLPSSRLREEYLIPFFRELGFSRYRYRMIVHEGWMRPLVVGGYLAGDALQALQRAWHLLQSGESAVGARCRLHMRLSLLAAPFVLSGNWIKRRLDGERD